MVDDSLARTGISGRGTVPMHAGRPSSRTLTKHRYRDWDDLIRLLPAHRRLRPVGRIHAGRGRPWLAPGRWGTQPCGCPLHGACRLSNHLQEMVPAHGLHRQLWHSGPGTCPRYWIDRHDRRRRRGPGARGPPARPWPRFSAAPLPAIEGADLAEAEPMPAGLHYRRLSMESAAILKITAWRRDGAFCGRWRSPVRQESS